MPRIKTPDHGLKMILVDSDRQVIPGCFEHALCYLVDHEIDLAGLEARYRNDTTGTSAFAPNVLLKTGGEYYTAKCKTSRSRLIEDMHNEKDMSGRQGSQRLRWNDANDGRQTNDGLGLNRTGI